MVFKKKKRESFKKTEVSLFKPGNVGGNGVFVQELGMFRNVYGLPDRSILTPQQLATCFFLFFFSSTL